MNPFHRGAGALALAAPLLAAGAVASAPAAAAGPPIIPPPPKAADGAEVQLVGAGVPTPTSFAFGHGTVFAASGPAEPPPGVKPTGPLPKAGIFALEDGKAVRIPHSPKIAFGLAWHRGKLYATAGSRTTNKLLVYSGWNGKRFKQRRTIYTGPRGFTGFNGIAFGRNGLLYAGVDVGDADHTRSKHRYGQTILTMRVGRRHVRDVRVYARGIRQPWMATFVKGQRNPFFTVLGQDGPKKVLERNPPDYIIVARRGQNYGFPKCNRTSKRACRGFAKPRKLLPTHSSPMGIAAVGKRLYVALFGGPKGDGNAAVISTPASGRGKLTPVLTGFVAPIVALNVHRGWLYVGELTGQVFRVRLPRS